MPELPEVETVRRQLEHHITDKTIDDITVRSWKSVGNDRHFVKKVVGQSIEDISRSGKYLFFTLSEKGSFLICHLRMTGRLIYVPTGSDDQIGGGHTVEHTPESQPHEHTRVIFSFADGSHLYFNDMRKFGYIKRADSSAVEIQRNKLGPEPLTPRYTADYLKQTLDGRNTSVKAVLLKQTDIAGIGNIYADEACWRARIRPDRKAGDLEPDDIQRLYDATQSVLADSLSYGGTTFEDYADTNGEHGNFTDRLAVFGRDGQACPHCGQTIEKIRVAGRGTHVCPNCQS
jgi:formamidopyrimidine-DNA glycosylase